MHELARYRDIPLQYEGIQYIYIYIYIFTRDIHELAKYGDFPLPYE